MDWAKGRKNDAPSEQSVKRPRCNRVSPLGEIEATHHKGALMGNRGDLHAPNGSLGRNWRGKRWLSCVLDNGGWHVPMDQPGHYYPLFFHDEAVALAAGHRPCGACRSKALKSFLGAWAIGSEAKAIVPFSIRDFDQALHISRLSEAKDRPITQLSNLPDGVFVWSPLKDRRPSLIFEGRLWPWRHGSYDEAITPADFPDRCFVLTPSVAVSALRGGYRPLIHPDLQRVAISSCPTNRAE